MLWRPILLSIGIGLSVGGGCAPWWFGFGRYPRFPAAVDGWQAAGEEQTFDRASVAAYLGPEADRVLAYDFQRLWVRHYAAREAPRLVAEVYVMSTSEDAYGLFSLGAEGEAAGIGQDGVWREGVLRFWKGAYVFRIVADRPTPEAKAAMVALGRELARPVRPGPRPLLLDRLPRVGLQRGSVRYLHTAATLAALHPLAEAEALDLSPRTDAALASYRRDGREATLLLVRYKNAQQARAAYRAFARAVLGLEPCRRDLRVPRNQERGAATPRLHGPGAANAPRHVAPVEGRGHAGAQVEGRHVAMVLEAPSAAACERLLSEAARRL
ncbi:MAG: DUF6599 family protein [Candidatus Brocadiia bacterium]